MQDSLNEYFIYPEGNIFFSKLLLTRATIYFPYRYEIAFNNVMLRQN